MLNTADIIICGNNELLTYSLLKLALGCLEALHTLAEAAGVLLFIM